MRSLSLNEPSWLAFDAFIKISQFQSIRDDHSVWVQLFSDKKAKWRMLEYEMVSLWYESWYTGTQSPFFFHKWLSILNRSKWTLAVNILAQILLTLLTWLPYLLTYLLQKVSICGGCFLFFCFCFCFCFLFLFLFFFSVSYVSFQFTP